MNKLSIVLACLRGKKTRLYTEPKKKVTRVDALLISGTERHLTVEFEQYGKGTRHALNGIIAWIVFKLI